MADKYYKDKPYSYTKQIRTVVIIMVAIVGFGATFAYTVWDQICGDSLSLCFSDPEGVKPIKYLLMGFFRPFTLFPQTLFAVMGAKAFGHIGFGGFAGIILMSLGSCFSFMAIYGVAKLIGKRLVTPWLSSNLPQTFKFTRSQDWKIAILTRLVPVIPFDLLSFVYGVVDFRFKPTLLVTFLVSIAENYLLLGVVDPSHSVAFSLFTSTTAVLAVFLIPGAVFEWVMRKKGSGLFRRIVAMWNELMYEIRLNNDIIKRQTYIESKTPVLLLYGFFSSRRTLSVMERLLKQRGYDVLSFNLGGLFGVFFTRGIIETAQFINYKLMRQFSRNSFDKIHIVAHSKGGLVALWWVLKLGGYRYCDKVVTLGTPFKGSRYTWLALVTPLGLWWKDVWQMRPGSSFLRSLSSSEVPENLSIHCFHSNKDKVSVGDSGIFKPTGEVSGSVHTIPMNHISHFEFLYKKDVADKIANILGTPSPAKEVDTKSSLRDNLESRTKINESENSQKNKDTSKAG